MGGTQSTEGSPGSTGGAAKSAPTPAGGASPSGGLFSFGGSKAYVKQSPVKRADYDFLFKFLMVGDSGVGKSSLLLQYSENRFVQRYLSTIGVDFKIKTVSLGGHHIKLQLWDTSGQERFQTITSSYYRGAHGFVLVYDVTNRKSFEDVRKWTGEIERYASQEIVVALVGNKTDLANQRVVSESEGVTLAAELGALFIETSAKTSEHVDVAFHNLTREVARMHGVAVADSDAVTFPSGERRAAPAAAANVDDDDDDVEEFDDDDLADGWGAPAVGAAAGQNKGNQKKKKNKKTRRKQADVNVFRLDLDALKEAPAVFTGEPIRCRGCGCVFSAQSTVKTMDAKEAKTAAAAAKAAKPLELAPPIHESLEINVAEDGAEAAEDAEEGVALPYWPCEFCCYLNVIDDEDAPRPDGAVVDYLVTPAPSTTAAAASDGPILVLCIDVSGSMCVTSEVPAGTGKSMRGSDRKRNDLAEAEAIINGLEGGGGVPPRHRASMDYVSRLQCVQAAMEAQIERVARETPNTRVAIITFADDVVVVGDGTSPPVTVAGDALYSFERLEEIGATLKCEAPISESKDQVLGALWDLEEGGATCLGPALQLALKVAGGRPGSEVVLCTDGLANKGVGSLEGVEDSFHEHYTELAEQARLRGVTVSVVSIKGDECRLVNLALVAEQSGGKVDRVDAWKLGSQLASAPSRPTLATGAMAMVCLHRGVHFRGEMDDEKERRNWLVRDLGTVHAGDESTFNYGFRPKEEEDLSGMQSVPFQAQILYTHSNGGQYLKVATAQVELTASRQEAEASANAKVVGAAAVRRAARAAQNGRLEEARLEVRAAERLMQRAQVDEGMLSAYRRNAGHMDRAAAAPATAQLDEAAMAFSNYTNVTSSSLFS